MDFEEIKTKRLLLRKLTPEVYWFIHENYTDDELMEFLALKSFCELTKEKEKYAKGLSTHNKSFVNFKLFDLHSGLHIGNCGFHTWYVEHYRAEIGYDICTETLKGKGFMTEALQSILEYGFGSMNLNRIEAFVSPQNIPSLKLMQKFGFQQEGHLRQHYNKNDEIQDSAVFSLLKHEYRPSV